jgi:hypothetical protein
MRRFTPEEDAFIREHYPTKRLAWIAEKLGRPDTRRQHFDTGALPEAQSKTWRI